MADAPLEQWNVYYSGRVQGVGFRYTARQLAARYVVTGYVENLDDGRVHVLVEGMPDQLEAYLADIGREMSRFIHSEQRDRTKASGRFDAFEVRR
jgi:acylphosphatase